MRTIIVLLALLFLSSCVEHFDEDEVYGYYSPVDYKNNFDTLQLQPGGVYHRKVYNINRKLLLDLHGKWKFENNFKIYLDPFYLNLDDDLVKFPENVNDTSGGMHTYFETHNGKIQFCTGYQLYDNCYRKIE